LLYLFADFALDTEQRELRCKDDLVPIEPQVFDLLTYLIDNRKRVVSKDDLIAAVWEGRIVSDATLDSRVNAARRAIGDSGGMQRLIKTLPRKGIRFVGAVRQEAKPAEPALAPRTAEGVEHPPRVALPLPERPSIAVLPFVNMSGDPEQEYFVDGMAEEIITALARCSWLFVIARNSSFTYKNKVVDVRQIGRELGVRYVLEGSVRRVGDRLRFTGQLIEATSGTHIWADRFDGEMSDVFELQDRFTASVVAAIEPVLQLAEIERLKHKPAANLDAYDQLLRAQQRAYDVTEESLPAALRFSSRPWPSTLPTLPPWPWRPFAMQSCAGRAGRAIPRQKRRRGFALPRARSRSPKTTAMSCGWQPLRSGSWRRMALTLATSPTARCGSTPTRPWP
jgi:TolB-like protein